MGLPLIAAVLPPLITAGAGVFSQERTNKASARDAERQRIFNAAEAQKGREFNALEAQKARDFSAEQSATEVQRRVADLRAAGLNPALALGDQASSGGGVAASGPSASSSAMPQRTSPAVAGVNSALMALEFAKQIQQLKINQEIADVTVAKGRAEVTDILATQPARIGSLEAGAAQARAGAGLSDEQKEQLKLLFAVREQLLRMQVLQTRNAAAESGARTRETALRSARDEEAFRSGFGRYAPWINSGKALLEELFQFHVPGLDRR